MENLEELRREIAETDKSIIALMKKRISIAHAIGEKKQSLNLPVKDYLIEKKVFERNQKKAKEIGLYEEMAHEISHLLIKYAVIAQDEIHRKKQEQASADRKKMLIIGGLGHMGQWLAHYFDSLGHTVSIADKQTSIAKCRYPLIDNLEDSVLNADIIIISTPISKTAEIIHQLISYKPSALIFDVCSLKSPILEAINKAQKSGLKITSIHPMFGPSTEILSGKNIVFCQTEQLDSDSLPLTYFSETSANLITIPLEDHDKAMAYVLGLSHLANLVFAETLSQSGFSFEKLQELASSTFQAQINVVKPVTEENQALYYEIQESNQYTQEMIQVFHSSLADFRKAIDEKDQPAFMHLMENCKKFFNGKIK
ncbi:MAG: prephenate dehydrogenase/arogenate dehydrogenase family protein [Bdellovibrionota bacterium]